MPNLKSQTIRRRSVRKKRVVHQPLHRIAQILIRHRFQHLAALDRYHAVHVGRGGQPGAAEGLVFALEAAVALLADVPADIFAAVVEGDYESFAGDCLA